MKVMRAYHLPRGLLADVEQLAHNRSAAVEKVAKRLLEDPAMVLRALRRRLTSEPSWLPEDRDIVRVSVTIEHRVVVDLEELVGRLQLPTEHVLKLAMEECTSNQ